MLEVRRRNARLKIRPDGACGATPALEGGDKTLHELYLRYIYLPASSAQHIFLSNNGEPLGMNPPLKTEKRIKYSVLVVGERQMGAVGLKCVYEARNETIVHLRSKLCVIQ